MQIRICFEHVTQKIGRRIYFAAVIHRQRAHASQQRIIRLDGSRAIQFALRVFKLTFVEKNQGAIVADDDERCRIEMHQTK